MTQQVFKIDRAGFSTIVREWSEPKLIVFSFLAILFPSSLLMMLPAFSVSGLSFYDALFTTTSALSVTGLGVVDTGTHFTLPGKLLLMVLMQIGGLGQMTLSAVLLYMVGRRLTMKHKSLAQEQLGQGKAVNIRRLIKHIVIFAVTAECLGTAILMTEWVPNLGWQDGTFYAAFHAVSAFNNAGFSLFSDSMTSYVGNPVVNATIAMLFICGGIGFTVVSDLRRNAMRGFRALSLHSKIMLTATPVLLFVGAVLFWMLEHRQPASIGSLSLGEQWIAALFQSASTRTAGFNSVDISQLTQPTLLLFMALMLIGAGSTSTGGGIKVSTFVVAVSATWAFLRQRKQVNLFKRTVPQDVVVKSLAIIVVSGMILTLAVFALLITENKPLGFVMFEVISAFATVGLSAGLTSELSDTGKLVMVVVMVVGRIGPLTMAYLFAKPRPSRLKYPEDDVLAG